MLRRFGGLPMGLISWFKLRRLDKKLARIFKCCRCGSQGEHANNCSRTIRSGPLWQYLGGPLKGAVVIEDRLMYCAACDRTYCRVCSTFAERGRTTGHFCPSCDGEISGLQYSSELREKVEKIRSEMKALGGG
jgi:hypothetical protein